jgi:hypothetical protein
MKNILLVAVLVAAWYWWKEKQKPSPQKVYLKTVLFGNTGIAGGLNLPSSSSASSSGSSHTVNPAVAAAKSGVTPVGGTTPGGLATFSGKVSQSKSCFL